MPTDQEIEKLMRRSIWVLVWFLFIGFALIADASRVTRVEVIPVATGHYRVEVWGSSLRCVELIANGQAVGSKVDQYVPPFRFDWRPTVDGRYIILAEDCNSSSVVREVLDVTGIAPPPPPEPEPDPPPIECPACPGPEPPPPLACTLDDTHDAQMAGLLVNGSGVVAEVACPVTRVTAVQRVLADEVGRIVQRSGPPWVLRCESTVPSSWQVVVECDHGPVVDTVLWSTPTGTGEPSD